MIAFGVPTDAAGSCLFSCVAKGTDPCTVASSLTSGVSNSFSFCSEAAFWTLYFAPGLTRFLTTDDGDWRRTCTGVPLSLPWLDSEEWEASSDSPASSSTVGILDNGGLFSLRGGVPSSLMLSRGVPALMGVEEGSNGEGVVEPLVKEFARWCSCKLIGWERGSVSCREARLGFDACCTPSLSVSTKGLWVSVGLFTL